MFLFFIWVAVLWQSVLADSNSCSSSVTISSQTDADNLSNCDSVGGSVIIGSSVSGTITINSIEEIKGSLTTEGVAGLTELVAPNLDTIHGSLTLDHLDSLTGLTMNSLSQVASGITISSNPNLRTLHFEDLGEVDGQLIITGSFTSVTLPSLDQVNGRTTIKGARSMSCNVLNSLQSDDVYLGGYTCSTTSGSTSLSAGAKGGIAVGVIVGVLLLMLLLWYWLRQRRQQRYRRARSASSPTQAAAATAEPTLVTDEKPPSPKYQRVPAHESRLSVQSVPRNPIGSTAEMIDGRSIYEAPFGTTPVQEVHELEAGPVFSTHQRPIHSEG